MKNRCKAIVLSLILASMIISGCGNNNLNPTKPETPAAAVTEADKETNAAKNDDDNASSASKNGDDKEAAKAYLEQLKDTFHEYANSSFPLADELEAHHFDEAEKCLDNMKAALDKIKDIAAPSAYSAMQAKLVSSLTTEYDYINLCRKFIGYCKKGDDLTEDEKIEVEAINKELELTSGNFTEVYLDLVKTVKADIDK